MSRAPHDPELVEAVHVLGAFGHSLRAIAAAVGISKSSVAQILNGAYRQPLESTSRLAPGETRADRDRCPRCGALLVVVPCRVCCRQDVDDLVEASDARITAACGPAEETDPVLSLCLEPQEQARYEEVRWWRASGQPLLTAQS